MTEHEIIDKVYEDIVAQAARNLLEALMIENPTGTVIHANAESRFRAGLTAAARARDRAKEIST